MQFFIARSPDLYIENLFTVIYFFIIYVAYYYYLLRANIFDFVRVYYIFCFFIAILGLLQEGLFLISPDYLFYLSYGKNPDFMYGDNFNFLRIASLLDEPSRLGLFLLPAIAFGFGKYFLNTSFFYISKKSYFVICLAFVLTFSSHAYMSLFISIGFLLLFSNKISQFRKFTLLLLLLLSIPLLLNLDSVAEKIINTGIFSGEIDITTPTFQSSSFYWVALKAMVKIIEDFNVFGVGMMNYHSFVADEWRLLGIDGFNDDGSNIGHARILVEFGILGYLFFIIFMYRFFIFKNPFSLIVCINLQFINNVSFIFILVNLFRMGFYINPPLILFVVLFVVSKTHYKKYLLEHSNTLPALKNK